MAQTLHQLGIDPKYILVSLIGFVILVFVLSKYAFRPIADTLDARQKKITGDLTEAEARRDEMVRLQKDYEQRLAGIEDEARETIAKASREANAVTEASLGRAREEAAMIVQRGTEEVDAERAKAIIESRDQIVDLASALARRAVKQELNVTAHAQLIDEVIAGLSAKGSLN